MKNPMKDITLEKECRNYYLNQAMTKAYEKADALRQCPSETPAGVRARKQYESMTVQIEHVDTIRSAIRRDFGTEAERMFTCCCIDGMDMKDTAARFSVPDDFFRKSMCAWIEKECGVSSR